MFDLIVRATLGLLVLVSCQTARAEGEAEPAWYSRWWDASVSETKSLVKDGSWDVLLPFYEYHLPIAYTDEQRAKYNQSPMPAFGLGRSRYHEDGNRSSLYVMGFRDSNDFASWMGGYSYSWLWDLPAGTFGGLGVTGFIMARQNYGDYTPFPAILPTATVGWKNLSIDASYVPGFKKGTGNVIFMWITLSEKGRP